jgi:CRP/FNR family transcriptional regulator
MIKNGMNLKNIFDLARANGQSVSFKKNTTLFKEGDSCQGMLLVTDGSIKVLKYSDDGKEALLYRVNPNNLCILSVSCLIGNKFYNAEGIAEFDVDGIFLTHKKFMELLNTNNDFRSFIFSSFAERISDFIQLLDNIIFKSLKERLIDFITIESSKSSDHVIHKTHQEIAIELGSSREVISRILKTLENEKIVDLSRFSIKKI